MSGAPKITVIFLVLPVAVQAEIVGVPLGYYAPPDELGGYAMIAFPPDDRPLLADVISVPGPTGKVLFDIPMNHRRIGEGWYTWSHGYAGDVYYTNGLTEVVLTLPPDTGAFILYAQSGGAYVQTTATANDGTSVMQYTYWGSGGLAAGYGFYTDGATDLTSITVSTPGHPFAVGEFSVATIPDPATLGFQPLGDLPGGFFSSGAHDASADGSVVVGGGYSASGMEAFRWTQATGMAALGDLPGGPFESGAYGVSSDGSVVVGHASSDIGPTGWEGFRWTQQEGMVGLGALPGGAFDESWAFDVSADGLVIVGFSTSATGQQPFRWTQAGGMVGLRDLSEPYWSGGNALGVSADGSVVVGGATSTSGLEAFHWTEATGMVGLGDLPGGEFGSTAWDVSADGSVVVGESNVAGESWNHEAFRWTQEEGMVSLGVLGPGLYHQSRAQAVSADGAVVVGWSYSQNGQEAFIWDADHGMRSLRDVLMDDPGLPFDLSEWTLTAAQGISADGMSIVGVGTNPDGFTEAWLAYLPRVGRPIPTVSEQGMVAMALLMLIAGTVVFVRRRVIQPSTTDPSSP